MVKGNSMSVGGRVLVTGGAGFIGSHLCQRLLSDGNEVICADNFTSGSRRNLAPLQDNPDFECIRHDVRTPLEAEADQIFHLAGLPGPRTDRYSAAETANVCVNGALHALTLARHCKAPVLDASTAEVYGMPEPGAETEPFCEDAWGRINPSAPCAGVVEGARCAEALFLDAARAGHMPVQVARLFSSFGPRMNPEENRVVSRFIMQALRGENITVFGEGTDECALCYVDDVVEGLIGLMGCPQAAGKPVNIGQPTVIRVQELAEMIVDLIGSRSQIIHCLPPVGHVVPRVPDIRRAQALFGWSPATPIEAGLSMTIAWFELKLTRQALKQSSFKVLVA